MGPKTVLAAILCTTLLVWSGASTADGYRPGEFLSLDLTKAVLSPKPLGPATQFAPVRIEARADPASSARVTPAKAHVEAHVGAHVAKTHATKTDGALRRAEKPRGAARTKLARPRGNPLDAQASDTRIQVWPCRSGALCNWK